MQKHILTVGAGLVIFVVGFGIGKMNVPSPIDGAIEAVESKIETVSEKMSDTDSDTQAKSDSEKSTAVSSQNSTQVSAGSLTASQKQMMESLGMDPESVTITAAMIACAEAKLGSARIAEFQNGATPSFLESASLMTCYTQQ